ASGDIIPEEDQPFPQLWHCNYAVLILKTELDISNPELLQAVLWHSTGEAGMTTLQKILFLADYIEPTREFEGVRELRRLAAVDLDRAVAHALKMKLNYLQSNAIKIHPRLIRAYDFYVKKAS
ncbi:MAG: bis(5'-nucleosyl)-tetraphosphatase (symmetrical) YqeK, partial [Candidatus Sumerlaeia bacterium]|nr:bis(5'-nucleosyl)-tetraphosphatase (symmetrical) YqeK [Candidatus Sumerlaeia bacterium]